ncbi:MAG: 30S ribosomal protein S26e [Candidatus Odinarchaeia archaeon]
MPKKRKSGGRAKGSSGKKSLVQCSSCGKLVARDKAKKVTKYISFIEPTIAKELRQAGTYIPRERVIKFYCVSCAVHRGVVKIRARDERK